MWTGNFRRGAAGGLLLAALLAAGPGLFGQEPGDPPPVPGGEDPPGAPPPAPESEPAPPAPPAPAAPEAGAPGRPHPPPTTARSTSPVAGSTGRRATCGGRATGAPAGPASCGARPATAPPRRAACSRPATGTTRWRTAACCSRRSPSTGRC